VTKVGIDLSRSESLIELLEMCDKQGATAEEKAIAMKQYIEFKARSKGVPMRGTLELTPLCNLDCKMCYVHLSKQQLSLEKSTLLTGRQWISIIQQAIECGMLEATLTGGEALLHPDFDEILSFLADKNIQVNLKSNGVMLTEDRIKFLKNKHIAVIQISLYGCDEDSYERVTGKRYFARVIDAIRCIKETGIPLEVVITPSIYMFSDIERILRLVDSMGIRYSVNPGLITPFEETGRAGQNHDLNLEQYIDIYKMRAKIGGILIEKPCIEDIAKPGGNIQEARVGLKCGAGRSVFAINWRGDVLPCRGLESISFNGLETPFSDGWKYINDSVKKYPIPMECAGCKFEQICPSCVIQHGIGAEIGHANKTLCQRALRLAEEGFIVRKDS